VALLEEDDHSHKVSLSPDTSIRLSLSKMVIVVAGIISLTAGSLAAWTALKDNIKDHARDEKVHLDVDFTKNHGLPIGKWDLQEEVRELKVEVKTWRESIDKLTTEPIHFEDCTPDGRRGVKCRWRH